MTNLHSTRLAHILTTLAMALATVAGGVGLFWPEIYRETNWVIPQNRGQDLVTLGVVAVLAVFNAKAAQGSPRAILIWLGLLGYLAYTYTGAAFSYNFNYLFLIYVALFGCVGAALIAGFTGIRPNVLRGAFSRQLNARAVAGFLIALAVVLSALWLAQIIPFYLSGELPEMIVKAKTPTVFVYVLDLGVVVPLALLSAYWLLVDEDWGYVLAGLVLVKATAMGVALLFMSGFASYAGIDVNPFLSLVWLALALSGFGFSYYFFAACRNSHP